MKRGAASLLAALCVLAYAGIVWGNDSATIKLLNLGDRNAVVISVDGEALVSDLVVHNLRPSRIEALYRFDGELPQVGALSGNLIKSVAISPRPEGFMLTLTLADNLPVDGEQVYRESVIEGTGSTALEVFANGSARTPFKAEWLDGSTGTAPMLAAAPAVEVRTPAAAPPEIEIPAGSAKSGFDGVVFDRNSMTLTIRGAGAEQYAVKELAFPPRVDVTLPDAAGGKLGVAHKDLSGKVTLVEVTDAKAGSGLVVRTSLAPNFGLVDQQVQGSDLLLTFGPKAAGAMGSPKPAGQPASAPLLEQPRMMPQPAPTMDAMQSAAQPMTAAPPAGMALGEALSSAVSNGGTMPDVPTGLGGAPQQVPSVEQILTMAKADAQRYGKNASGKTDQYGTYELPTFEGEKNQLSDVRVSLNASTGFDVYAFLMYLSSISGISIIIDPYLRDDPTGALRQPKDPGFTPGGGDVGAGFRPGSIFDPQLGGSGFVIGQFNDIPFDQALDLVLETQNLRKVVYRNPNDPYAKPVILITSKERVEQELQGQNQIDLYQLHYANPNQIYQILYQLRLLPSVTVGWYVYSGGGSNSNGGGGTGGGNNSGGGNSGGGGNRGGGGGGNRGNSMDSPVAAEAVRNNYFDPLSVDSSPMQARPGGGGNAGGGGGGGNTGGGGGGGNNQGGGGGGNNNGGGVPLPTAKSGLVVMRGTRETLDTLQALIQKIDKPPKQVTLKVKVYQVSDDPQEVWGLIRATAQKDRINAAYELGSLGVNVLQKGGAMLPENYTAAFEFLQQQRKAKLITETEVAVLDGFNATIDNTRTRGQLSGTLVVTADGQVINQPVWNSVTVGTNLDFTPQVDDRGRITLQLNISLSNFDGPEQVASANGQQVTFQPTVNTDLTTTLRMTDGQTALIGGLTTSEDSTQFLGIPYLSKLPLIGPLFGRTEHTRSDSHIFITIQTNIIDDK
jgi:hypothetical protein